MSKIALPQAGDWNKFWEVNASKPSAHVSFSKKRIVQIIQPYIVRHKFALDAGCGSGFFSKHFCDSGMRTTSLDYSSQALAATKEVTGGRSNVIQVDLCSPDLSHQIEERFDVIFTDGLFEHFTFDDQNLIMLNFQKILNDNGVILTFVPNRYSPWEWIRPFFMPGIHEEPFTLKELIDLNVRNGLNPLNSGGINIVPFILSPDQWLGPMFGMLLFTISKKDEQPNS